MIGITGYDNQNAPIMREIADVLQNREKEKRREAQALFAQAVTVMVLIAAPAPPQMVAKMTLESTVSVGNTSRRNVPIAG
ncbi:MAG TPA: hypothetical protein VH621_02965, partial [Nitrososphaera sp.]